MADLRDAIEEIRHRVNVLEVISEYVSLKHGGKNYLGLCPFHAEKTPSFTVREEFQTWHCFGCGEHGDVFTFVMKMENLTFNEALERLARRAGVDLAGLKSPQVSRREVLVKINSIAAEYYSALLKRMPVALEYLRGRGLADSTIEQFRLGYAAPAWDGLGKFLAKKGISEKDAEEVGLLIRGERGYYDRFRHRIVYPILDIQERIIGFGGRAFGDDNPKYLNSPETPLFSKTKSIYGLNLARKSIADTGFAVVVEGYMDVIATHQAGFYNCVATLGTALTPDHIKILARYTQKIVLAYDADSAGMKAALRGASMFYEAESDVSIARLPGGDDPDSLLRKGKTTDFTAALQNALPVIDYRLELLKSAYDLSLPAARTALIRESAKIIADLPSVLERERHIKGLARLHPNYDTGSVHAEDHIRQEIEALIRKRSVPTAARRIVNKDVGKPKTAAQKAENAVLRILARRDYGAESLFTLLSPDDFTGEMTSKAAKVIFETFGQKKGIYLPDLLASVDKDLGRFISELAMSEDAEPVNGTILQDYVDLLKNNRLKRARTSDIFAPFINDGIIDPANVRNKGALQGFEEYLKKTGKKPQVEEQ